MAPAAADRVAKTSCQRCSSFKRLETLEDCLPAAANTSTLNHNILFELILGLLTSCVLSAPVALSKGLLMQ